MGADDEPASSAADAQADTAVQRLEAAKAAIGKVLDSRCSDPAGWDRWVNDVVSAVAAVVGIADIDGALKKNGASPDKLQRFAQAKGDDVTQLQAAAAVRRKIDTCAATTGRTAPSTDQLVQSVYIRADAVKRQEEGALGLEKLYRPIKRPGFELPRGSHDVIAPAVVILIAAGLLTSCAPRFDRDGKSQEEFERDCAQCLLESTTKTAARYGTSQRTNWANYAACMSAKGYPGR